MNNWVEVGFQKFASFEPELTQLSHTVLDPTTGKHKLDAMNQGWRVGETLASILMWWETRNGGILELELQRGEMERAHELVNSSQQARSPEDYTSWSCAGRSATCSATAASVVSRSLTCAQTTSVSIVPREIEPTVGIRHGDGRHLKQNILIARTCFCNNFTFASISVSCSF